MLCFSGGQASLILTGSLQRGVDASGGEDGFRAVRAPPLLAPGRGDVPAGCREAAEMFCGWFSTSGKVRRELASPPSGLWLATWQETGRAQEPPWKSHLSRGSKPEAVSRTRK